jgi:Zn-dependent protease with chaperone function
MKRICCLFLFGLLALSLSQAQATATGPSPAAAPTASSTTSPTDAAPQTPILEYSPPPAQYARAKAYSHEHYTHTFINTLYGLLILLFILRWRVAPKFRDLAERVSNRRFVQLIIFAPLTLLTINFLTIPSDVWDEALQRAYGLSVQTWPAWFTDWITNMIIMLIVGTILVAILYGVIRRSPRRWWFYFWLASIPVLLIVFFIEPVIIDPLFFKFTPLANTQPALVAGIEKVTHRGGIDIPRDRMFLMNASSKTTTTNAYVTGFGSSKRVVIWDTTIAKATIPETLFVFGHEMGHYVLLHIPKEMSIIAAIILAMLYLGYRFSNWMLARWGYQWGIRDIRDWASLPALMFVIGLLIFLATPAINAVSRHFEHEADRYGLEVIHGIVPNANQVAAHYFEKSGEMNLSDPDPNWFIKAWFFDHPTRPERVHFVATYDPWSQGKEPEYVK